jgi:acyltransferase
METTTVFLKSRIYWIDNAKVIALLSVMLAHTKGSLHHSAFIHSFAMPLFFFLSGYVFNKINLELTFFSFVRRQTYKIVIPYLFYWAVSYIYLLLTHLIQPKAWSAKALQFSDAFSGLLFGINDFLGPNVVLWFFTCFFVTTLMFHICHKFIRTRLLIPFSATLALAVATFLNKPVIRLPWNIDASFVLLFFITLGYFAKEYDLVKKLVARRRAYNAIPVPAFCLILYYIVKYNGSVYESNMVFGTPILYFMGALIGISMVIYLSHALPESKCFRWLSANTMIVFPLHQLYYSTFTGVGVVFFDWSSEFISRRMINILYLISAVILSVPASFILRRYFPFSIGITPVQNSESFQDRC